MTHNSLKRRSIFNMLLLTAVAIFASDAYLPSLPAMANALGATHTLVKLTITSYFVGLGISPLIFGPCSDRFGRRPVLVVGLLIAVAGSFLCVIAHDIHTIIVGRAIQAFGVGCGLTLGRTVVRDIVEGKELAKIASIFGMLIAMVPAIAPTVGGYVQHAFNWRGNFVLLMLIMLIALILLLLTLPETLKEKQHHVLKPKVLLKNYWELIKNRNFCLYALIAGVSFSSIMAYLAMSPFLFQTVMGLTPIQFGWLAFVMSFGIMTGSLINNYLMKHFELNSLLLYALVIMFFASGLLLMPWFFNDLSISAIMIPLFFYLIGIQMILPNAFSLGFSDIRKNLGTAGALFSSLQTSVSIFSTALASLIHAHSALPIALIFITTSTISLLLVAFLSSTHNVA